MFDRALLWRICFQVPCFRFRFVPLLLFVPFSRLAEGLALAYAYSYCALGEGIAWFIGWNLTLEYAIVGAAVASAWSGYVVSFFKAVGLSPPDQLYMIPTGWSFCVLNPLAVVVILLCTILLLCGVKESALVNNVMTTLNLCLILFIIIAGATYVDPANWTPFAPYGASGVIQGAATVFFAYVGFDTVTALAGESCQPERDIPLGVILTVGVATVLYIFVGLVMTGMVSYLEINVADAPLADAFLAKGCTWGATVIAAGSVTTMTSTTLCSLMGQPRIYISMSQDGLFFPAFQKLRRGVPVNGTLFTGGIAALLAFFFALDSLADMISLGTLFAFTIVCIGVLAIRTEKNGTVPSSITCSLAALFVGSFLTWGLLRGDVTWYAVLPVGLLVVLAPAILVCVFYYTSGPPNMPTSGFVCPLVPFIPVTGIILNIYLITQLSWPAYVYFIVWTLVGLAIYFGYGIRHSKLLAHYEEHPPCDAQKTDCETPEQCPSMLEISVDVKA